MGQSTDAILVYGVPLKDDADSILLDAADEHDHIINKLIDNQTIDGIYFEFHCSGDYPMYIVAIENSKQWAWRGHPIKIDIEKLSLDVIGMKKKIAEFVSKYNLKTDGEIGWWMASYWG